MSWTKAQTGAGNTSTSGSGSIVGTYGSNVTAGNLLIAGFSNNSTLISGVTDTLGNTWTKLIAGGLSSAFAEIWYAIANGSGANAVTGTNQSFGAIAVSEFSPGGGTISVTGTPLIAFGSSGSALASGNITLASTPALVIGVGTQIANGVTFTAGSGFTMDFTITRATHVGIGLDYALAFGSSPANALMTASLAASEWAMAGAAFLSTPASSGGASLLMGI